MDRSAFFAALRRRNSGVFGTSLSKAQVKGCEAILDAARWHRLSDRRHVANVLGQVFHETGGYMLPIKETVYASHRDKEPSDATVIARLDRAYKAGDLPWVSKPYWRDGWFGRGQVQLTHRSNYEKMGGRLGVDLVSDPDLALDPDISADIAVVGMARGMFTGKKLSDFFSHIADDPVNARRIVNGPDGTDQKVAGYHKAFLTALKEAEWKAKPEPAAKPLDPAPAPEPPDLPEDSPAGNAIAAIVMFVAAAIAGVVGWIAGLFGG